MNLFKKKLSVEKDIGSTCFYAMELLLILTIET